MKQIKKIVAIYQDKCPYCKVTFEFPTEKVLAWNMEKHKDHCKDNPKNKENK